MIRNIIKKIILEAFDFDYNKTFMPPNEIAVSAKNAINSVNSNDLTQSGTNAGSGKKKAQELSEMKPHNYNMMRRLKSYFDTNKEQYDSEIKSGKTIANSPIIQAWELHGGNKCYDWVVHSLDSMRSSNLNTKKNLRKAGGAGVNKGMGIFDTKLMSTTNHRIKK